MLELRIALVQLFDIQKDQAKYHCTVKKTSAIVEGCL